MYIEELVIDNYMSQVHQWESLEENDEPYPEMPEIAQKYHEKGELWLDSDTEQEVVAPDILGMFG